MYFNLIPLHVIFRHSKMSILYSKNYSDSPEHLFAILTPNSKQNIGSGQILVLDLAKH